MLNRYRPNLHGDMIKFSPASRPQRKGYYHKAEDVDELMCELHRNHDQRLDDRERQFREQLTIQRTQSEGLEKRYEQLLKLMVARVNIEPPPAYIVSASSIFPINNRDAEKVRVLDRLLNEACNAIDMLVTGRDIVTGDPIDRKQFADGFNMYLAEEWGTVRDDIEITSGN